MNELWIFYTELLSQALDVCFRSAFLRHPFIKCKAESEVWQRTGEEEVAADVVPFVGKLDPIEAKTENAEVPTVS